MTEILKAGKSQATESQGTKSPDNSRRSFFLKLGAGASTALASTAGLAGTGRDDADGAALRAALLEEEQAIRKLRRAYEQAMDKGRYEEAIAMFAEDAEVVFNGGVFRNRSDGISRLYRGRFRSGKTGKSMEPAPGFEPDADGQQDSVEVSPDRLFAKAQFPYSIQVGKPFESDTSLASMARLHGEGVQTWWEGGVYRVTCARDAADGRWQISRLEYDTLSRADYRPGRSYARSISVSPISTLYPEDQDGADALV